MIYIVHGEDFSKSRELVLNQQRKLGVESRIEVDVNNTTPEELFSLTHSNDLFSNPSYVILNISKAGRTNMEPYLKIIKEIPKNTTVVLISDKTLSASNIFIKNASAIGARISDNPKIPLSNTFKFIDAVFFKKRGEAYMEMEKLIEDDADPIETFSMLQWGLRNVAQAKFGNYSFFKGKDYVKNKSEQQGKLFDKEALKKLYWEFFNMDKKAKTGGVENSVLVPLAVEKVLNS